MCIVIASILNKTGGLSLAYMGMLFPGNEKTEAKKKKKPHTGPRKEKKNERQVLDTKRRTEI